jgi:hypothetical protein
MNILVTGAKGFVGRNLVAALKNIRDGKDRTRGDSWRKGYRVTGYFLYWLQLNKDKDFIRKFNRSTVELKPWSWDKAMKHILGDKPENTTDALWQEYMKAVGD